MTTVRAIEVIPDYIHIFISTPPFSAPSKIAKILKGVSARRIFQAHPELRKELRQSNPSSANYYYGTARKISTEVIKKYIHHQKRDISSPG